MEELRIRASLNTAGITSGMLEAIRATQRLQASIKSQMAAAGVSAGSDIGRNIARSIDQAGAQVIARAVEKALVDGVRGAAGAVSREVAQMMQTVGQRMQNAGRTISFAVTAPILALGGVTIKAAADLQKLRLGLVAITGSSEEAGAQLARLEQIAKLPGIGFEEALKGSQSLQAVGFSAAVAERSLKAFANTIALTGGGRAELERVTVQLAQMASAGKILTQDLRPLIQTAPALGLALKNAFGTVNAAEIEALGLSVEVFFDRLLTAQEALARAPGGVANSFDNLADSLKRANAVIGDAMLPLVVETVDQFSTWLETVRGMDTGLINLGISVGAALAVIGPLTLAVGTLAAVVAAMTLAVGGLATILTGGVILALGALAGLWVKNKLEASQAAAAVDTFAESIKGLTREQLLLATANAQLRIGNLEKLQQTPFIREIIEGIEADQLRFAEAFNNMAAIPNKPPPVIAATTAELKRATDAAERLNLILREAAISADFGIADRASVPLPISVSIDGTEELRQRISSIKESIESLREAGRGAPTGTLELLARLQTALTVAAADIEKRIDAIQEQFERLGTVQIAPQIAIPSIKIPAIVDPFSMAALERSLERTTTGITERLARGLIDPGDFEEQGRIAGAAFNAGILDLIARLRASGALTEALEIELVGKLIIDAGVGDVDTSGFDKTVQAVQQVTSGFEAMANALGDTSTELSAALRAIDSFTSGLALLKQAQTQAGATAALTQASGVLAIGAAVFGVAKAILEGADAARRAQKEFARSMEDWERMLNGISLVDQAFIDARSQFEERTGLRNVPGSNAEEFNRFMQEWMATFGKNLPPETFEKISKAMELFNLDLQRSVDAIRLFANSLAGAAQQRDLENKLRGVELDPTQQISGLLNDLLGTFPDLFKKIFADLNPADLDISDLPEIRQAALDFFESIKGLTGAPLEAILGDASIDDFLGWLGTLADGLNTLDSAVRDTATSLLGVPEVFNFTLASLRAAGTREFLPQSGGPSRFGPDRDPRTPSQDNRTTVAAGAVQITVAQDGDELLDKIADVVAVGLERAAKLGGKTLTASEIRQMLKPELVRGAQSGGAGARELALNWPG